MTNAVQQLIDEREKLLTDIRTDDEEFLKLLRTMAKFHRYSFQDQLNLCRRAPEDCRALATKSAYAKYFNTQVTPNAIPVILQAGENTLKAVYDIEETVGFLRGDRELTQLPRRYSPAYEEDLLQFMGAQEGETLDEALHENLIIMTAGEEPLLTVSEYIVRSRLELPTDENAVLQMDREQVIQRLPDIHETAKSVLDLFKEEMDRYASRINSDTIRGNGISEDTYGRTLGIPAPGVSGGEQERGVADDDQKRDGQAVPQGLPGGNERSVYRHSGTAGSETGRNGRVQDEGRAGVHQKVQSSAADRNRDSDAGNQSVTIFSSIRKWYGETYPEDEIKNDIKDISFRKALDAIDEGKDFYGVIGVGDSVVRDRIFQKLSEIKGRSYDDIYQAWRAPTNVSLFESEQETAKPEISAQEKSKQTTDTTDILDGSSEEKNFEPNTDTTDSQNQSEQLSSVSSKLAVFAMDKEDYSKWKGQETIDLDTISLTAEPLTVLGKKQVLRRNLAAIQIYHQLALENRLPTERELTILRAYTGFGGLAEAFDSWNKSWANEYAALKDNLTPQEYESARHSVLTAYYTPRKLIQAIYEGLQEAGLKGPMNVLDPSMGSGRFFQEMPEELKKDSHTIGIELDSLTAKISRLANQSSEIVTSGFEDTNYSNGAFDLSISNVPFEQIVINDPKYPGHNYFIHDYFLNKMIDNTRRGGLIVAITSTGTLDKADETARRAFAQKADLVKAIRLPQGAFRSAGTFTGADILIFRRREKDLRPEEPMPTWVQREILNEGESVPLNSYFFSNRADILGSVQGINGRYGAELSVTSIRPEDFSKVKDRIAAAGKIYAPAKEPLPVPRQEINETPAGTFTAGLFIKQGVIFSRNELGKIKKPDISDDNIPKVTALIQIRDYIHAMLNEQLNSCSDERLSDLQAGLNERYDEYVKKYSHFAGDRLLPKIFAGDPSLPLILSLENSKDGKFVSKTDFFTKRTVRAYYPPTYADTAHEALAISMQEKGGISLPYMSELMDGKPEEEIVKELEFKEIFLDIGSSLQYVPANEYLSGDVRQKIDTLDLLQKNILNNARFQAAREASALPRFDDSVTLVKLRNYFTDCESPFSLNQQRLNSIQLDYLKEHTEILFAEENRDMLRFLRLNLSIISDNGIALALRQYAKTHPDSYLNDYPVDDCMYLIDQDPEHLPIHYDTSNAGKVDKLIRKLSFNYSHEYAPNNTAFNLLIGGFLSDLYNAPREERKRLFMDMPDDFGNTDNEICKRFETYAKAFQSRYQENFLRILDDKPELLTIQNNITALEAVKPKDLTAEEINISLGAAWIRPSDIKDFASEVFNNSVRHGVNAVYAPISNAWKITAPDTLSPAATVTYGVKTKNAFDLLEAVLNHQTVTIKKVVMINGEEKMITDRDQTLLAMNKIQDIKAAFKQWIYKSDERKTYYADYYNRHFNNIVPRQFDGSNLTFPGMNPEIHLRPHQKDAIARILYGGNTLLAHVVGAGKTFEMQASAMEAKRIGLCKKSMMIMPKHLIEQFGTEFMRLYPQAKILIASPSDFTKEKRREFCARIATQDWDAVVMSYEQFKSIPLSAERRRLFLSRELDRIVNYLDEARQADLGRGFSFRQALLVRDRIQRQLNKLDKAISEKQDNTITFEQLGIDRLYVDESHYYKNLYFHTRMKGFPNTVVEKTDDMLAKCDYLNELTGERGVVFASGTPISNSMSELYTLSRYLKPSRLTSQGFTGFDLWASTFGEEVTVPEIDVAGSEFRYKTRFSKFTNVPELMSLFREFGDVKLADQLQLDTPDYKVELVQSEPSPVQRQYMRNLIERAEAIRTGNPKVLNEALHNKDSNRGCDNMLNITHEARLLALDERSVVPEGEGNPTGKVAQCVEKAAELYHGTAKQKSAQVIFCDEAVPNRDGRFCVYDIIKQNLIEKGVKENEISFIHSFDTPARRDALFRSVREGKIRILLGSTDKLGVGTNIQNKLIAIHELDCPWKPAQIEQRRGRIVRVGNENKKVHIYRYITKGTFDAYVWQMNERKQSFVSQIMRGDAPSRTCEDYDEVQIQAAQAKTACTENPVFKEKMTLETELKGLYIDRAQFFESKKKLEYQSNKRWPIELKYQAEMEQFSSADLAKFNAGADEPFTLDGVTYRSDKDISEALTKAARAVYEAKEATEIDGSYHGLIFKITFNPLINKSEIIFAGNRHYFNSLYRSKPEENLAILHNLGQEIQTDIKEYQVKQTEYKEKLEKAKELLKKPYGKQDEIDSKERRLSEVDALIFNSDEKTEAEERGKRLDYIHSPKFPEKDRCAQMFMKLARAYLAVHSEWDDIKSNDYIAHCLLKKNFSREEIIKTLCTYSPTVMSEDDAKGYLPFEKRKPALSR